MTPIRQYSPRQELAHGGWSPAGKAALMTALFAAAVTPVVAEPSSNSLMGRDINLLCPTNQTQVEQCEAYSTCNDKLSLTGGALIGGCADDYEQMRLEIEKIMTITRSHENWGNEFSLRNRIKMLADLTSKYIGVANQFDSFNATFRDLESRWNENGCDANAPGPFAPCGELYDLTHQAIDSFLSSLADGSITCSMNSTKNTERMARATTLRDDRQWIKRKFQKMDCQKLQQGRYGKLHWDPTRRRS